MTHILVSKFWQHGTKINTKNVRMAEASNNNQTNMTIEAIVENNSRVKRAIRAGLMVAISCKNFPCQLFVLLKIIALPSKNVHWDLVFDENMASANMRDHP